MVESLEVGLFRGCIIPYRFNQYEKSARVILNHFGVEIVDVEGFTCCGSLMAESASEELFLTIAGRNLAVADESKLPILTLCGSCTATLNSVRNLLLKDLEKNKKINDILALIGRKFSGISKVKHISNFLLNDIGLEKIKENIVRDLSSLKVAVQTPCQIIRPPSESLEMETYDFVRLVETCGVEVVDYEGGFRCCGSTLLPLNKPLALELGRSRIEEALKAGADLLVIGCGNCASMFDVYQNVIDLPKKLPVLFFTQLIGYALGYSIKELGMDRNYIFEPLKIIK